MSTLLSTRPLLSRFLDDDTLGFPEGFLDDDRFRLPTRFFNRPLLRELAVPAVNIRDAGTNFEIEVAVPGFKKEELKVSVKDGLLTISSEKKHENEEEKKGYTRREFGYSAFTRSFTLPEQADAENVKATFADGVLKLQVAKNREVSEKKGKEIKIG